VKPIRTLSTRILVASLGLLLNHSVGSAERPRVVVQGDGIAVGRDANITGDIIFGVPAREVHALLEERMRFRADHLASLEKIGQSLVLGECSLTELVQRVGRSGADSTMLPQHLVELTNRHDAVAETAQSLDAENPEQAAAKRRILEANREGSLEQAESLLVELGKGDALIAVRQGIAAGRDVNVSGDVVFGVPRKAFESLVGEMQRQESAQYSSLQRLSEDLSVNRCATASFLKILGEGQVPTEQLHSKLKEIAGRHLDLVEQLRAMTTQDPDIEALRKRAAAALDTGDFEAAEGFLREAHDIVQAKSQQASPLMSDYARVEADLGRLHLARLRYGPAADSFVRAAKLSFAAGERADEARYQELAGGAYQDAGVLRKAEAAFIDALAWREANPDQSPREATIITLNNLGVLYLSSSDYGNAMQRFEQALETAQSSPDLAPEAHGPLVAASHQGLADAALALSDLASAEEHYTEALLLLKSVYGAEDRRLVPLMTNWARLKSIRGDYAGAEALYRRAMDIDADRRMAKDPESAVTMNNLAALYYDLGKYEPAEALWQEVIEIYRSALGDDSFITLGVSQNLARILRKNGDLDGAEAIYKHALSIWEQHAEDREVEDDHLVIASLFASLGDLYVTQRRLDEAEEMFEEALDIVRSRLGRKHRKQHLLIASYRNDLAVVYEGQGRYDESAEALAEVREIMALKLGEDHPSFGTVTSNLARVQMRLGRLDEAVRLYLVAITIAAQTQRPLQVASRRRRLAAVYRLQGRLADAEVNLKIARDLYERELSPDHPKALAVERELTELEGGMQL
jgi:tetratricopeptide (TPR) repeat protein